MRFTYCCRLAAALILTACLLVDSWSTARADVIYDLKTDWSDAANPNGPWTYREGVNALPHVADWQGLSGDFTGVQPAWARFDVGTSNLPAWFQIASPNGVSGDWQFGDIVTHTTDGFNGLGSGESNVIWTSPINGTIDVSGNIWMGRDINRGNHWELSLNGSVLTSGDVFSGDPYSRSSPFVFSTGSGGPTALNQLAVVVGDILRLQLTRTSGPGDYSGVNLSIDATAVPEGSALAACGLFVSLALLRRRRASSGCMHTVTR